ncbi:MAG: hypothetical protein MUE69_10905 [Myxococcota bacterium]|nr:hypothetical protein [Myxococcota bacterium]
MSFGALPFDEQMARVRALVASGEDPEPLLREAAGLADPEPFARVVSALLVAGPLDAGRLDVRTVAVVDALVATLPDASLQHVIEELPADFVVSRVEAITSRWGVQRIAAIALLDRWLRRHDDVAHRAWRNRARARLEGALDVSMDVERALILADGRVLERLAREPATAELVRGVVARAVDVLARAPKSISQANAERLLARRVYADPGHFFFELLQNADDAGASSFEARIDDTITIRHDGAPFSLLDLVGVLSIGQTTKRAEQIGFFGVGFKSVYEVCERPRIRSGALAIEIAHVSIPRLLSHAVDAETTLALPLSDRSHAPRVLARALAMPPETLLTLSHVRALRVIGGDGVSAWRCELEGDRASLVGDDVVRRHVTERGRFRFDGAREEGRARECELLVAAAIEPDESGGESFGIVRGPTLHAFLPTAERTGLRVLVHARFDVTLDRERLELDSPWNEALLAEVGRALARLVVRFGTAGLALASTREELAPAMGPLGEACAASLAETRFLSGATGESLRPDEAWIAEPDVARALAGIAIEGRRMLDPAALAIESREAKVACELGAARFGARELVAFVRGALRDGEAPPPWRAGVLDALGRAPVDDAELRALPLVVVDGRLRSAEEVRLASAAMVALYRGERVLVSAHDLPEALARRLSIARFEARMLVEDLCGGGAVRTRTAELFAALEEVSDAELGALRDVTFMPVAAGDSATGSGGHGDGDSDGDGDGDRDLDLAAPSGLRRLPAELSPLGPWLVSALPFVSPTFAERRVVRRLVRDFTWTELVSALEAGLSLDGGGYAALEARLDAAELPEALARRIEVLLLFEDRAGVRRPLVGPTRASCVNELVDVVPGWPWLAREGAFVRSRRLAPPSALTLARALVGDPNEPSVLEEDVDAALAYVASCVHELPSGVIDALARASIWRDAGGTLRTSDALRAGGTSVAIDAAFSALGTRHAASVATLAARRALGLATASDRALLVGDVVAWDRALASDARRAIVDGLLECLDLGEGLSPLMDVPIWLDVAGTARVLGTWRTPSAQAVHRAGERRALLGRTGLPLLDHDEEVRLAPLLDALGAQAPSAREVLANASRLANDPEVLLDFARRHVEALDAPTRVALAALPIVTTLAGTRRAAKELVPSASIAPLDPRSLGLADEVAADDVIETLGLPHADLAEWVRTRVLARLVEGERVPAGWRVDVAASATGTKTETETEAEIATETETEAALRATVTEAETELRAAVTETETGTALRATETDTETESDERSSSSRERAVAVALVTIAARLSIPFEGIAIALDDRGRMVRAPLFVASEPARALCAATSAGLGLADVAWVEALGTLATPLVRPLPLRRLVEAMRRAPERVSDEPLYELLRTDGEALARDAEARALFSQLPVWASQSGERRAARELVLDPDVPELGLGWGLAAEVPIDVAEYLRATFEIDRHARRAMVSQLLDALAEAARVDDADRARELLAFLARALVPNDARPAEDDRDGALAQRGSGESLEERVRRLDVRARLVVPVVEGTGARAWTKPRFSWSPADDVVEHASLFVDALPPRVLWTDLDGPSRRVLAACGAEDDLDEATWVACLDRIETLTPRAQRALARYVLDRGRREPARIDRAGLRKRRWLPSADGSLRVPSELVLFEPLTHALLGDSTRFVDSEVASALDDATGVRLGLRGAAELSLAEIAAAHEGREAPRALLDFLEAGLDARRFAADEVRARFSSIRLRDDEGILRAPRELVRRGGRALFGSRRGDWSASQELPRLARALGIPSTPDDAAIVAFLEDVGASLGSDPRPEDEASLVRVLPECLQRLRDASLPEHAALAVVRLGSSNGAGQIQLTRLGDPSLRRLAPPALAELVPTDAPIAEPLPIVRDAATEVRLERAGVPDLFVDLRIVRVEVGPRRADPRADALATRVGRAVRVHDTLAIDGALFGRRVRLEVDAALDDDALLVTPAALDDPSRCASALGPEPRARQEWLARLEGPLEQARERRASTPPKRVGLFDRVRRFFGGDETTKPSEPKRAEPVSSRDARLFRPRDSIESQLDRSEGWVEARREVPSVGLAFTPPRLVAPWIYAPQLVVTRFERRGQRWIANDLPRPSARGEAGRVVMRGRLPAGESVLPVPLYGELESLTLAERTSDRETSTSPLGRRGQPPTDLLGRDQPPTDLLGRRGQPPTDLLGRRGQPPTALLGRRGQPPTWRGVGGTTNVKLLDATELRLAIRLGEAPRWDDAHEAKLDARVSFVPDDELPDEALDLVASLDEDDAPFERALAVRDFVRRRYRYDPSYLEDPAVGRHLARLTRGRAHAHVAALHAGADGRHLGAGVCYELNALACELMRRAGIPAGLASGWVLDGGSVSEPDHLWALALLEDSRGNPVWLPIDASSTEDGRPLLVPRRPPVRFRAPIDPDARAPEPPRDRRLDPGRDGPRRRDRDDDERDEDRDAREPERHVSSDARADTRGSRGGEPSRARRDPRAKTERAQRPPKKARERRLPRAELYKVLHHLGRLADCPLTDEERAELERALHDPKAAAALLERLRRR